MVKRKNKSKCTTFYKRNAGFTFKNEYLSSNKIYGKLERCASKSRPTLILPLWCINGMITVEESYELFSATISYLDKERLDGSDDVLSDLIFEELSSDAVSFLHEWTVDRLIEAKKIPVEIRTDVLKLRTQILAELERTSIIEQYRNDSNWELIRKQAQAIKEKINDPTGFAPNIITQ